MTEGAIPALIALWVAFLASHVGLSSARVRPALIARLGERGFMGLYSLVSFAFFLPLVWVYATNKHVGAYLWYGSAVAGMRPVVYVGIAVALTLIVGSFLDPSPASLAPGSGRLRGVLRITRHPLFMGVGLLGLLHLLVVRVHVSDLVFFAGLPIVGVLGCWHQDLRKRAAGDPELTAFIDGTAFLPFARGGATGLIETPLALILGVGATVAIRWFHPQIFGGAP